MVAQSTSGALTEENGRKANDAAASARKRRVPRTPSPTVKGLNAPARFGRVPSRFVLTRPETGRLGDCVMGWLLTSRTLKPGPWGFLKVGTYPETSHPNWTYQNQIINKQARIVLKQIADLQAYLPAVFNQNGTTY